MPYLLLSIICYLPALSLAAGETIHYFDLRHRPAHQVILLLEPVLQPHEAISGDGFQLFIKAAPEREQPIKKLISAIDRAIKTLRISITSDEYMAIQENRLHVSARLKTGKSNVQVGKPVSKKSSVVVHADTRYAENKNDKTQFVQVQAGKPAFVSRQKLHIVPVHTYVKRLGGNLLIDHHRASTHAQDGFYVLANLADDQTANVSIQAASSNQTPHSGYSHDQTYVHTSLRVKLGKWFEIGGNNNTYSRESKGILYRSKSHKQHNKKVFVKIELSQ